MSCHIFFAFHVLRDKESPPLFTTAPWWGMKSSLNLDNNPTLTTSDLSLTGRRAKLHLHLAAERWGSTVREDGGSWECRSGANPPAESCSFCFQKLVGRSSLIGTSALVSCCGLITVMEEPDCDSVALQHVEILPTVSTEPHKKRSLWKGLINYHCVFKS